MRTRIIIATLATAVLPRLVGQGQKARIARAKGDIASIGLALDLYELDVGRYPGSVEELTKREPPTDLGEGTSWNGPYLKKGLPNDPWGRTYSYNRDSQHNQDYDVWSLGPDGQPGNDDVTNWD